MPELYLRGDGCGTGMTSAGNVGCGNRRASRRYSQAGDAAAPAAAFRLKRRNNQFVIEIDPHTHAIVWQFGNGSDKAGPRSIVGTNDAERFRAPHADLGNGIPPASPPLPGCCEQQSHRRGQCRGRTRVGISHQHRVRQQLRSTADARRAPGQQQHLLNTPGNGFNRLNGPYDAKVVGDFTGLTPPLGE